MGRILIKEDTFYKQYLIQLTWFGGIFIKENTFYKQYLKQLTWFGRIFIKEDTFYKQYLKEKNILVKHTAGYKQMSQVLNPMDQEPVSRTNNRYIKTYLNVIETNVYHSIMSDHLRFIYLFY